MTALSRRAVARLHGGRQRLATVERGAAGVEYGILIAAVAAVIIVAALALGTKAVVGLDFVNGKL